MIKARTLKSRMMIYYGLSSVLILSITSIILIYFLNSQIIRIESEKLKYSVESSAEYISLYITNLKKDIELISNIEEVKKFINNENSNKKTIKNILNNIKNKDDFIEKISIITRDGRNITSDMNFNYSLGDNMLLNKWYVEAMNEGVTLNTAREKSYYDMDSWVLSLSKNIYENDENKGLILLDLQYLSLYEYIKSIDLGKKGQIYIITDKNSIIFANDISKKKIELNDILKIKNMHFGYNKKENAIYFNSKINGTNLEIIGLSSGEKILFLKSQVFQVIIIAFILTSLTTVIITKKISDKLTISLDELKFFMQNMDDNLENIKLNKSTYLEIDILKQEINLMIDKIKDLKKYEIDSLYSQINPHFLYNTLDILIWMIEFEDNEKAIKITKNLSSFFRISLSQGKRLISLESELDHVRNYLEIQKQRYQNRLEYSITYDEDILDCLVPKIIIQPLVENSIYHGTNEIDVCGHINVRAYSKDDDILIEIEDNGIGIENSKKNRLKLGGVGMKNIDQRIKYYYGNDYGLIIKDTSSKGTTILLKLKKSCCN